MLDRIAASRNDFLFSSNGDFSIRHGDLETTHRINGLGFIEEVELRIKSSPGDWYFDREKGAGLENFEGTMLNSRLLKEIENSISDALSYDDFLTKNNFRVSAGIIDSEGVAVNVIFSDNITKYIDYRIQDVRIVFDLKNGTPKVMRN